MSTSCPLDARVYPTVHIESAHRVLVSSTESPGAAAGALYGGRLPVCHLSVFPPLQRVPSRGTHPRKSCRRLENGVDKIDNSSGQATDIARQNPRPSVPYTLPPRCQGPRFGGFFHGASRPRAASPPIRPGPHPPRPPCQRVRRHYSKTPFRISTACYTASSGGMEPKSRIAGGHCHLPPFCYDSPAGALPAAETANPPRPHPGRPAGTP